MHLMKKMVLMLAISFSISSLKAQYIDSTLQKTNTEKEVKKLPDLKTATVKNPIRLKSFIVPAFMITYGATTLKSTRMQSINNKLKDEVMEKPHAPMHIDNYLLLAPAAAVYALNIAGIKGKNNFRDRSILLLMSGAFTNATVFAVKGLTHETRPDGSDDYSFPSGHTAQAFASAEFMRQEYKDVSPWYGVAGYITATATGMLRMYNNKHWLSDVVAGAGVGIASTKLAYWIYPTLKRKIFKDKPVHTVITPFYNPGGSAGLSMVYNFH